MPRPKKQTGRARAGSQQNSTGRTRRKPKNQSRIPARLILLNKPFGVVSQFSGDGPTLATLVPIADVYPAGRLDKDSEGLLLLTDQGWLQHRIAHPSEKSRKHYWAQVDGQITESALTRLQKGVTLKDGHARAVQAERIEQPATLWPRDPPVRHRAQIPTSWLNLIIAEGRNRQVRRMTAVVGFPTLRLIRHRTADWHLQDLQPGEWQTLTIEG